MRQRVGFARAIVIDPTMLLMDEPFSALDVLTAETLRTDFLDLWTEHQLPIKSVLMVTHNIEEAVLMCDRILVLSLQSRTIAAEIQVPLPHPRDRLDAAFRDIVDEIYSALTARAIELFRSHRDAHGGIAQPLPAASPHQLEALVETLATPPYEGRAELGKLASGLPMRPEELLPVTEALHILEFAEIGEGAVSSTAAGLVFAKMARVDRRKLFAEHLLRFVPLVAHVTRILDERTGHLAPI